MKSRILNHIASTFRLKSLFVSLIRTTGSPPWVLLFATAVVVSETFFVVSFFGRSLCKSLLCRLPQMGTLHVLLLQSFDMLLDLISSFNYFNRFELFTSPNGVLNVFEGTFKILGFAWLFSVCIKGTRLRFITALKFISVKRRVCLC